MSFLSYAWLGVLILGLITVNGLRLRVWERHGHLVLLVELLPGRVVMPERGWVDGRRWVFIGKQWLGVDGGGR